MTDYIFLTTSIVNDDTSKLERMIDSIRDYESYADVSIRHILLLQNVTQKQACELKHSLNMPTWTELLSVPGIISLSKARNIMLCRLHDVAVSDDAIIAFPDDDCWYPKNLLKYISNVFTKESTDFFFCRYGTKISNSTDLPQLQTPGYRDLIFNASSNTLFIRADIVKGVGYFDEQLGVGAKYNGGEDLDYAVRAFRLAKICLWCDEALVGHRDKIEGLRGIYFTGSARVLRLNACYSPIAMFHFWRKILIGFYLVLCGEMPVNRLTQVFERSVKYVKKP
jgi:hypothetical protein